MGWGAGEESCLAVLAYRPAHETRQVEGKEEKVYYKKKKPL